MLWLDFIYFVSKMENRTDFFQKKMSGNMSFSRKKKKSKLWIWLLVALLLLVVWLVSWKIFDGGEWEENNDFNFSLWEEVFLQWEIKADGDIVTYTHTIDDVNYWKIWLKSDSINLSDYAGFAELTWIVEKFYQSNPIVRVYSISWSKVGLGNGADMAFESDGSVYIPKAGVLFLPNFFDEYVLLNEWENGEINIQNVQTNKKIVLKYFRCNSSDPSRNCKGLIESFENNQAQSSSNYEWDVYYRQSENQWFVANGDWWGIFINDVSEDEMYKLKDLIKFANEKNIKEWVKLRAASICQWSWEKLQKINNSEVLLKQEWLIVTVSGDWNEKQITCQILVDFSLPTKWQLQSLMIWDDVVASDEGDEDKELETESTWDIVDQPISVMNLDTNVPQFPIKEEWLEYKSARWGYSLQFPSSNISYSVSSVKENFGRNDVSCSYVINVVKYSDKENLETSPAVRIYECQWNVGKSWGQWIVIYSASNKKFVVQMNDGAWNDFSTHLKFQAIAEE